MIIGSKFIKILFFLTIIFFFFPAFYFYIPGIKLSCLVFFFLLYIFIISLFLINPKSFQHSIFNVIKNTPLKYFACLLLLMILNSLIHSSFTSFYQTIRILFLRLGLVVIPIILFFICTLDKYISYKKFIRVFIFLFWLMLLLGFIAYLGQCLNIEFINNLFDFVANKRILATKLGNLDSEIMSNYEAFGIPRLDNTFEEPGHYGQFLFLFLPMVYSLPLSTIKITKNILLNRIIKLTIVPFTWLSIILTFSPIFLCFSAFITVIYYYKNLFYFIKKYFVIISITLIICALIVFSGNLLGAANVNETYLSRIFNVLFEVRSYDDFIMIEPSLATRVCSYINALCVFKQHILFGVGYGHIEQALFFQYQHSPVSLTVEMIIRNAVLASMGKGMTLENIISYFLAENGIILFSLFAYFIYILYSQISQLELFYKKFEFQFEHFCAKFLKYSIIALCINAFYNLNFLNINMYLLLSMGIMLIFHFKLQQRQNLKEVSLDK